MFAAAKFPALSPRVIPETDGLSVVSSIPAQTIRQFPAVVGPVSVTVRDVSEVPVADSD